MTFADDSNTLIIIVLGKSERQVPEFWVENLVKKKKISREKNSMLPSISILISGKKTPQNQEGTLDWLTLSCNRNNTCVC